MTTHESLIIDMDTSIKGRVKMRNGNLGDAIGKGSLVNETKKGKKNIREVMLVPGLDENLLNVGKMIKNMYFLLSGDSMVEIYDDGSLSNLVASVLMRENKSLSLFLKPLDSISMTAIVVENVQLST